MYIVRSLNLPDIKSFLDKYKSKTPFIKTYGFDDVTGNLDITLQNDAIIRFSAQGYKQTVIWPNGTVMGSWNDAYYVLGLQSKFIFQNPGAFIYGSDLISGIKNTYFIIDAKCLKCNSKTDLDPSAGNYQLINVILPYDNVFNGQSHTTIIDVDVFVQSTTIKLESLACISGAFSDNMVDYSESAIMSTEGVDLYYLFKLPKLSAYLDGVARYYALIDEDGYQN